jgi:hypothetical protein
MSCAERLLCFWQSSRLILIHPDSSRFILFQTCSNPPERDAFRQVDETYAFGGGLELAESSWNKVGTG